MAASNLPITLPNPYTPMAFIPPELATKVTIQTYASVGALTVLLWDIFLHLPQDYQLATQFRPRVNAFKNVSFIIYCVARITSLAYVLGLVIITTSPVGNCDSIRSVSILYAFAIPLSVIPFVIRVSALFGNNRYVTAFFCLSWLSVVGGCIVMSIGSIGVKIGTTDYCSLIIREVPNALSSICPLVHDTLIFVATSWGLMQMSSRSCLPGTNSVKNGIRVVVFGRDIHPFTRSFLRDGQAYYLITLILNLCFVILAHVSQPTITACTIGIPHFVIVNTMSSYVYRNMRLGIFRNCTLTSSDINRAIQGPTIQSGIVFKNPMSSAMEGDLEAGGVKPENGDLGGDSEVGERVEHVTGVQTEIV